MKKKYDKKKYYKYVDFIRLLSCLFIILYHFGIVKGGYLAVCTFFVLSGFLSCNSLFNKDKISFKEYYINKLTRIYIPLLVVVFTTICFASITDKLWLTLKPEVNSIMLGFNNYWQLSSSMDYFSSNIDSPFIHLWYIAILLQFDLIFPFIFILFKKIGDKFNKIIPCIILFILSIISTIYFYISGTGDNLMFTYYSTFTRLFSLLFGVLFGFIYNYYGNLIFNKIRNSIFSKIFFYTYIIILLCLFIFIDVSSNLFLISMILVTLISLRIIDYGTLYYNNNLSIFDKVIKSLSSVSYEIYLVQYPIIYLFNNITLNIYLKYFIMLILIISVSYLIHFCLFDKNKRVSIIKYYVSLILFGITIYGIYVYYLSKDYTNEMNELRLQLNNNQKLISDSRESYLLNKEKEDMEWNKTLEEFDNNIDNLSNVVSNLSIVGIGDSVLLGAIPNLYKTFPNGYFDGKVSRTAYDVMDILNDLISKNSLGNPILFNLGTNGDCSYNCKVEILNTCGDRDIFWITTVNYTDVNERLFNLAKEYSNLHIIDWYSISKGHSEYFAYDGIHLTSSGREVFTKAIYDSIYNVYLDKYNKEKDNIINKHNENINKKVSFYGNDLLVNAFDDIKAYFTDSSFTTYDNITFEELKKNIYNDIKNNNVNKKLVFMFDNSIKLSNNDYKELIKLCNDYDIYIVSLDKNINIDNESITFIDFYKETINNNYLMPDKIHLNSNGNKYISNILNDIINN